MKILALDIATNMGVAIGEAGGRPHAYSVYLGPPPNDRRFSKVLSVTSALIAEHSPSLVAIEAPIGGKTKSDYLIGLVACVRGCAANRGVDVVQYQTSTVRKHFVGRALTKKDFPGLNDDQATAAIKKTIVDRCNLLGWDVPDHDSADAAALFDLAAAKAGAQVRPGGELFVNG